ncbi:hypothetical protein MMC24_007931 [Lignoscripta atroalba]|nr:hypothetical protein [Lignoscripta atroalba]
MVLAVGTFLVMFGACYSTPITVNYVTECFTNLPLEVAVTMNVYRQIFGLSLPFFVLHWQAAVGSGWMFGMMAFFCVLVSALMGLLIWKGQVLRQYSLVTDATEDGIKVTNLERTSTLSSSA